MNNLVKRTLTGTIFVGVILAAIYFNPWAFLILFCVITFLALREFYGLFYKEESRFSLNLNAFAGVYLFAAFYMYQAETPGVRTVLLFAPYLLYLLYVFIAQLYARQEDPIHHWAYTLLGQVYIGLGFALLNVLAFCSRCSGERVYSPYLLIAFFTFIWINDTGAFLTGSAFGRHRLFERISPKKSWEGFWGGAGCVLVAAWLFSLFFEFFSVWEWLGLGIVITVFSTWGDLCESLMKRSIHIKDSGTILPGHGGMLDRFDSALLASPAVVVYLMYICR